MELSSVATQCFYREDVSPDHRCLHLHCAAVHYGDLTSVKLARAPDLYEV